jgi:uncharacterized protein with HEPN domain
MPSKDPRQRFEDILENAARIKSYTADLGETEFLREQKTIDAVERCIERIAEAARKLGDGYDDLYPELELHELRKFGSMLRHDYGAIQPKLLWGYIVALLTPLETMARQEIKKIAG